MNSPNKCFYLENSKVCEYKTAIKPYCPLLVPSLKQFNTKTAHLVTSADKCGYSNSIRNCLFRSVRNCLFRSVAHGVSLWHSIEGLLYGSLWMCTLYTKYTYSVHFKIAFVYIKVVIHINKSEIDQCRTLETDIRLHCCTSASSFYGYWYMICVSNMHDSSLLVEENCMDVRWLANVSASIELATPFRISSELIRLKIWIEHFFVINTMDWKCVIVCAQWICCIQLS